MIDRIDFINKLINSRMYMTKIIYNIWVSKSEIANFKNNNTKLIR